MNTKEREIHFHYLRVERANIRKMERERMKKQGWIFINKNTKNN